MKEWNTAMFFLFHPKSLKPERLKFHFDLIHIKSIYKVQQKGAGSDDGRYAAANCLSTYFPCKDLSCLSLVMFIIV